MSRELRALFAERTDELRNEPFAALVHDASVLDLE